MLDKVHAHILDELRINARTDTIFILSAILINFLSLAINSIVSAAANPSYAEVGTNNSSSILIMFCFVALTIVVCVVSEIGLIRGRQASAKLIKGLIKMYKDNGAEEYYDASLLNHYRTKYNLFMLVILGTGIIAIAVPFIGL